MNTQNRSDLDRLLALVKPHWKRLALAMFFMGLTGASTAAVAWVIQPLLDEVFVRRDQAMLNIIPFVALGIFLLKGFFTFAQTYFMNFVGFTIVNDLRTDLYAHMQRLSLSFHTKNSSGNLISRILNDVGLIQNSVTNVVTSLIMDFFTSIGLITVLIINDPVLAAISLLALPAALIPMVRLGRRLRRLATTNQEIMGGIVSILSETFQGLRMIQAYNMTEYEIDRFKKECRRNVDNLMRAVMVKAFSSPLMEALGGLCVAGIIWYGGSQVISGQSTPGTFLSFMTALLLMYEPIKRMAKLNNEVQQGLSAARRIFDVLDTKSEIVDPVNPAPLGRVTGAISFDLVSFAYEGGQEALKNVSLCVKPGEMLAIVGQSGGGKTTLVNLVPRFFDPTEGVVSLDGRDLKTIGLNDLRDKLAIVSQEAVLFDDTVRHNIAYGRLSATDEEVQNAAKAALAHDFIMAMPQGYYTVIGERGTKLSGGQKQRLAIARAILRDAPVLILDEATSALDTESEKYVQAALNNLMKGRTNLVIAHRLSTIREADRIIVLKGGIIVEEGTHQELLAKNGEYNKLYQMQFAQDAGGDDH